MYIIILMTIYCAIHRDKPAKMMCKQCGFLCEEHEMSEANSNHSVFIVNAKVNELHGIMVSLEKENMHCSLLSKIKKNILGALDLQTYNIKKRLHTLNEEKANYLNHLSISEMNVIADFINNPIFLNKVNDIDYISKQFYQNIRAYVEKILNLNNEFEILISENSSSYHININERDLISDIKKKISNVTGSQYYLVLKNCFELKYKGLMLNESKTLKYYGITHNANINVDEQGRPIRVLVDGEYIIVFLNKYDKIGDLKQKILETEKSLLNEPFTLFCDGNPLCLDNDKYLYDVAKSPLILVIW